MLKAILFGVLIGSAGSIAWFASRANPEFFKDGWAQFFWILISTIITTFMLERILKSDEKKQERRRAEFAFRAFTGSLIMGLAEVAETGSQAV
jgi:hypothetical protein